VRVLIFHGYLLDGTGSNVYNARLAAALVKLGHEVHLLTQDRHPEQQPFVDATADWDEGALRVRTLREPVRCTVYRPDIGPLLPVYVADRYEGIEARTFAECSELEVARYLDANVAAVREVVQRARPDVALANHLVMGPVVLARGLAGAVPYVVKVHGSALEYTVKPSPDRFLGFAREGVAGARAVLVGSRHTALSLWDALGDPELIARTRLGPPGVDVERFSPRDTAAAAAGLRALAVRLRQGALAGAAPRGDSTAGTAPRGDLPQGLASETPPSSAFARDAQLAADAISRLDPQDDRLVVFVGKLIVSKGIDLLVAAWPLVLEQVPRARLVVVGFGAYREGLERLRGALLAGDMQAAREIAAAGRALEAPAAPGGALQAPAAAGAAKPLRHLLAFFDGLSAEARAPYVRAARMLDERIVLSGRLDHDELVELLPACEALVVPSTFPEAFGMVAAEAAACGVMPISASHSGLAEVSDVLARAVPEQASRWLSFPIDDDVVQALAERVVGWLQADPALRSQTRAGLVSTARDRWSWDGVARGVIAAANGELNRLERP
jgi:glycosyltransferase involved in cell wall biosynthesis